MKALVLGGAGFIGSHIVRALVQEGIEARVLMRPSSSILALEGVRFERVDGNLDDYESLVKALKDCEALFHVAGYYPLFSLESEEQKERARKQMENVLRAAGESNSLKKIIYTSSLSTIGIPPSGLANEETLYDPEKIKGLYYEIKKEMEEMALQKAKEGLPLTVVNPTAVFGDYDIKPTSGIFVIHIAKAHAPFLIDGKMNIIDVRDVAKAQITALTQGKNGERYILGGHNTTVAKLSQLIAKLAHVKAPQIKLPLVLGETVARASEIIAKYFFKQDKPAIPLIGIDFIRNGTHYDTTKAQKELGLKKTPSEETFSRALKWFKDNGYI